MLLTNAVNTEGRPLEIYVKDGKIAAVGVRRLEKLWYIVTYRRQE